MTPVRVFVEERLDETIACRNDDTIVSTSPPPQIAEGGKLAGALIVELVCDTFIEYQPINRLCTRFTRTGVEWPRRRSAAASPPPSICSRPLHV